MLQLVAVFGVLLAILGLYGFARPAQVLGWALATLAKPWGLYYAAGIRLVIGVVLLVAAPDSRFPNALTAFGILALLAAALVPVIGPVRLSAYAQWWVERPESAVRLLMLTPIALGLCLVYAAS